MLNIKYKIVILFLGLVLLSACKNELQQTAGEYSYKISGMVMVDTTEVPLTNEAGVVYINESNDALVLTFNMVIGDIYKTEAEVKNKKITLAPFERVIEVYSRDYKVKISGEGDVHDNNIVLNLQYSGAALKADSIKLEGNDILLLATRNK